MQALSFVQQRRSTLASSDAGSIVLGWLTRVVIGLSLLGIVVFDVVAIGQGHVVVEDHADRAALAARDSFADSHDLKRAYEAAALSLAAEGDTLAPDGFHYDKASQTFYVTSQHSVDTLVVSHLGFLKSWTQMQGSGQARALR